MPDEQLGVVVLTNMNGSPLPTALAFSIFDRYLGGQQKDRIADLRQARTRAAARAQQALAEAEAKRVKGTRPSLALEQYAGAYADSANGALSVALESGKLVLRYGPQLTGDLEHWHYDTFRAGWRSIALFPPSMVTFTLDRTGRVAAVEVERVGRFEPDRTATVVR